MEKFTLKVSHPTLFDEKSGGAVFCCATACTIGAIAIPASRMPAATSFSLKVNKDIVASPTVLLLQLRSRSCPVAPLHLGCRADARKLQSAVLPHSIRYNYFIGHEYFCIWTSAHSKLLLQRAGARVDACRTIPRRTSCARGSQARSKRSSFRWLSFRWQSLPRPSRGR